MSTSILFIFQHYKLKANYHFSEYWAYFCSVNYLLQWNSQFSKSFTSFILVDTWLLHMAQRCSMIVQHYSFCASRTQNELECVHTTLSAVFALLGSCV